MNPLTVALTLDKTTVRLSESVTVTATLQGNAPLVVTPPKEWLLPESAAVWRIRPNGPATLEKQADGQERWVQTFRADPYQAGELPLAFAPIEVKSGAMAKSVEWPTHTVKVQTSITAANAAEARPITGIEDVPPEIIDDRGPTTIAFAMIGLSIVAALIAFALRRRKAVTPTLAATVAQQIEALERSHIAGEIDGRTFAERLSEIVRDWVQSRFGLPAKQQTTTELTDASTNWDDGTREAIREVLSQCDRMKFAGREPTVDECRELAAGARAVCG